MQFANYADFRDKFQMMFDGDDISTSDISGDILDLIIGHGEQRIYRDCRSSTQDVPFSVATVSNQAPLPTDFLEMRGSIYVGNKPTSKYTPLESIQNMINVGTSSRTASPLRYGFTGDNMIFYPVQGDGVIVTGQYYKRYPDISTGLHAFFTRHPDLFMYAALSESAPFLGEMTRGPMWDAKYTSLALSVNEQERRRVTRGSKPQTRIA